MISKSRFNFLFNLPGKIYRQQPGRLTKAVEINDEECFVKLHFGVGFKEIFKNLIQGRLPILGARTEYAALTKLAQIGVPSLEVREFGEFGINPATQHSYLVTKALKYTISLEDLCEAWCEKPPTVKFKRQIIREVARIAATIHAHGMNHRDFYLCHFLFDEAHYTTTGQVKLYLIDLHRAQMRSNTPYRWRLKDIAGLFFSALNVPLSRQDLFCFMDTYSKENNLRFWKEVEIKAWRLYEKTFFIRWHDSAKTGIYDPSFQGATLQQFLSDPDKCMAQGKILKEDATTCVTKLSWIANTTSTVVAKRYHVRNITKGIKRFFKSNRARKCWVQALRLRYLDVLTPRPIAMLERSRAYVIRESYIVTEYLSGQDLFSYLREHPDALSEVARQMRAIFKTLEAIHTAHGDFKATNLWVVNGKIYLLDLDGVAQYLDAKKLQKALAKDKQRFLRNWLDQPELYEVFATCF